MSENADDIDDNFEAEVERANKLNASTFTPVDSEDKLREIVRSFAEAMVERGACRPGGHRRDYRATWRGHNDRMLNDFMAILREQS